MIQYSKNILGGYDLYALCSISVGPALALAMLAILFIVGENKNYKFAWIFTGCSAICHIYEGIYCFAIVFIVALVECWGIIKENICILCAVAAILIVIMPNMLTDKMIISDEEFVSIYAFLNVLII